MSPLSCEGSVRTLHGGRFNYGAFDPLNFTPFPALYLAEDRDTAWAERYGHTLESSAGLTPQEIVLTTRESVSYVSVSGNIARVIDLREPQRLAEYVEATRNFEIPRELSRRGHQLKYGALKYPDTIDELMERLLEKGWRLSPMAFDTPSAPQVFGQLVVTAGICGIVYPSTRSADGKCCLALFPSNFASGTSAVGLDDAAPPGATHVRLAADTYRDFLDM
jgi:RES domain